MSSRVQFGSSVFRPWDFRPERLGCGYIFVLIYVGKVTKKNAKTN